MFLGMARALSLNVHKYILKHTNLTSMLFELPLLANHNSNNKRPFKSQIDVKIMKQSHGKRRAVKMGKSLNQLHNKTAVKT